MNLDDFNPEAPMNEKQVIDLLTAVMIESKLEQIEAELPALVAARFPSEAHMTDWHYIDLLGCTAYGLMIGLPPMIVMALGGPIKLASMMMTDREAKFSPDALAAKLQSGFSQHSPTMAKLINRDVMIKVARLILFDWLNKPDASFEDMQKDTHFYLQAVLITYTDMDQKVIQQEAYRNMTAEDYAKASPEIKAAINAWKLENGIE